VKTEKELASEGAILTSVDFENPLSENPDYNPKETVQQGDAFENTDFKQGFEIVNF
jgi:hypothetical protein